MSKGSSLWVFVLLLWAAGEAAGRTEAVICLLFWEGYGTVNDGVKAATTSPLATPLQQGLAHTAQGDPEHCKVLNSKHREQQWAKEILFFRTRSILRVLVRQLVTAAILKATLRLAGSRGHYFKSKYTD